MAALFTNQSFRNWFVLFSVWVSILLLTPTVMVFAGEQAVGLMATLGVVASLFSILYALGQVWSVRKVVTCLAAVIVVTWACEAYGVKTGLPFGAYLYTEVLPCHLMGVPVLIPVAWFTMLVPAWAVARLVCGDGGRERAWREKVRFAAVSGVALTCWDFYVDPQMVEFGVWIWKNPSGYFGTPWLNFLGWWSTGFFLTLVLNPGTLPVVKLLLVYSATWILQAIGLGAIWGQPYPALIGFFSMGIFAVGGWVSLVNRNAGYLPWLTFERNARKVPGTVREEE